MSTQTRTNRWGIDLRYEDALHKWHDTAEETVQAILQAMRAEKGGEEAEDDHPVLVIRTGETRKLKAPATITLESGQKISATTAVPADLPTGYHQLLFEGAAEPISLIVSPKECWCPPNLSTWGWAVQLYSARSRESWGIGDFADLDRLARWSAQDLKAGMMLVNPLSSATPIIPQQSSPYYPTSRIFLNPLALHIEWIPNASSATIPELANLTSAAHELNTNSCIDRDRIFELKMQALNSLWKHFESDAAFDAFCRDRGEELLQYAVFCALAEHFKSGWHSWPEEFRHPESEAVKEFSTRNADRVRFYQWLQWLVDIQLQRSAQHLALMQDLPIGVDPDGADAWAWQDYFAHGIGVGAPPDEFNTQGQSWGLPPFVPHQLRAAGYRPFIHTIRAAFRHGGGLRIDHVMGLFRLFWIPNGMPPAKGAYVRYNADEMLAIVALESERAQAYVVGEDLGTVEDSTREKLAEWGVLSYRLLWFEKTPPSGFPKEALSAITTHDLPTVAGLWTGADMAKQLKLGLKPNEESTLEIRANLKHLTGLDDSAPIEDVIAGAYEQLAKSPSRILTAALDDAAAAVERPNIPATTSELNPNWSRGLPLFIEDLMTSPLPKKIAGFLSRVS